jgi:hypothetical protein
MGSIMVNLSNKPPSEMCTITVQGNRIVSGPPGKNKEAERISWKHVCPDCEKYFCGGDVSSFGRVIGTLMIWV